MRVNKFNNININAKCLRNIITDYSAINDLVCN